MTRVVLSIGSNLGDRLARLQSVVDGLDGAVRAVSPVYETPAWGGVEQGPFLNAVLIAPQAGHVPPAVDVRVDRQPARDSHVELLPGDRGRVRWWRVDRLDNN